MLNVVSLFATDFGAVSPGGIRGVVCMLAAGAPDNVRISHVGIGPQAGPLPRDEDIYIGLGDAVSAGESVGINSTYMKRLWTARRTVFRDADVVITHRAEHSFVIPRALPFVQILHGGSWGWWHAKRNVPGALYPLVELVAGLRAARTLTVAPDSHSFVFDRVVPSEPFSVAYDDSLFWPASPQRLERLPTNLVSTARLVKEKRLELVIQTAAALKIPAVHIFGEGPEREFLAGEADRLGVKLSLHGHSAPATISKWYREHPSVFMLTSMFEGFPVSALEAAGSGLPVVAIAAPGSSSAIPKLGGRVAVNATMLPSMVEEAWRLGNKLNAAEVAAHFGMSAATKRFWGALMEGLQLAAVQRGRDASIRG